MDWFNTKMLPPEIGFLKKYQYIHGTDSDAAYIALVGG